MKKIKLISAIATITAASPTLLILTQCNKNSHVEPIIDPSVSDKVTMTTETDAENNVICKIATKSDKNKITTVEVYIGNTKLTSGTDYKIDATNADSLKITIFKKTLDSYKGTISIKPTVDAKEFNGIIVEYGTYYWKDTMTKNDVHIFQSLEGTKGDQINWDEQITKIYDVTTTETDITSSFLTSGYKFTNATLCSFKIVYSKSAIQFSKTFSINPTKRQYTVSLTTVDHSALKVNQSSVVYPDEDTWGSKIKPDPIAANAEEVNASIFTSTWTYGSGTKQGQAIQDTDKITSNFDAKLTYSFTNTSPTELAATDCATLVKDKFGYDCYVPSACYPSSVVTPMSMSNDNVYTFTIDLDTIQSGKKFQYFWFILKTTSGSYRLSHLYTGNIISVTHNVGNVSTPINDYSLVDYGQGTYLDFGSKFTTGTIEIKYRPMIIFSSGTGLVPCFEAD